MPALISNDLHTTYPTSREGQVSRNHSVEIVVPPHPNCLNKTSEKLRELANAQKISVEELLALSFPPQHAEAYQANAQQRGGAINVGDGSNDTGGRSVEDTFTTLMEPLSDKSHV